MHYSIHPLHHAVHSVGIGQVRQHNLLAITRRAEFRAIRQAQHIAVGFEPITQSLAQVACCAGHQDPVVNIDRHIGT